jgi:hypothetical protein
MSPWTIYRGVCVALFVIALLSTWWLAAALMAYFWFLARPGGSTRSGWQTLARRRRARRDARHVAE